MNHIEDGIVAAADAQSLGGKAPAYYLQPRNLLDNSNFTNPVNQRGQSSYSGNFVRSIDRWLAAEGPSGSVSVEIEDGGITFTTSGGEIVYLIQRFEKGYLNLSKQHTIVAYMADGTVSFSGYIDTSEETMDGVNVTFPSGSKIKWVALYEGTYTADTLPPYVPKGYGAELAECQRYYYKTVASNWDGSVCVAIGSSAFAPLYINLPVPMRITPTVSNGVSSCDVFGTGAVSASITNASVDRWHYACMATVSSDYVGKIIKPIGAVAFSADL